MFPGHNAVSVSDNACAVQVILVYMLQSHKVKETLVRACLRCNLVTLLQDDAA